MGGNPLKETRKKKKRIGTSLLEEKTKVGKG